MSIDYHQDLLRLQKTGSFRQLRPLSARRGCRVNHQGKQYLNLSSNDYLGLAGDDRLLKRFYSKQNDETLLDRYGLGAASSRLLTGDNETAHRLEEELRCAYSREAALLFNSGYHANIGILPALLGRGDLILSDKLNHASIHDGLQLCRAEHKRFRHCDYSHLDELLNKYRKQYDRVVIVTESVFSMDGDVADLSQLAALKNRYDALLYVDEAHAAGLYGKQGLGKAEEQGLINEVDLLMGTFGKAYASVGAFLLCSADIRDYLINHSRSLIFTTALPPVVLHWNLFVFQEVLTMHENRRHLAVLAGQLRDSLGEYGLTTGGTTNIVPVIIGDNQTAVDIAASLQEEGYLIFPIRPPTVPAGTARFRLSVTADMTWQDIEALAGRISSHLTGTPEAGVRS